MYKVYLRWEIEARNEIEPSGCQRGTGMWVAWGIVGGMTFTLRVRKALATSGLDLAALDEVGPHLVRAPIWSGPMLSKAA